ncbi:spore coat U domain-containing protein [Umezakia ovalisporum]|uniref:Csu type fimbrial protein n=1 Tax=Umezakia ovalisporum TaxID=75695 RepID=UPI00269457B7
MIRRFALASAILIAAGSAAPAMAGTSSADLNVIATVPTNCTISTNSLGFGNYDPIGTNATTSLTAAGSVTTTCTTGTSATITLGQGINANAGSTDAVPMRRLKDTGSNYLSYGLYQDSGLGTVWGNTAGTGVSETGNGTARVTNVYGSISGAQNVPAGSYSDTVVATVTF